jgi:hypothetical protein
MTDAEATEQARQALLNAADLIDNRGWTQGAYARDADGRAILVDSTFACRFCMAGAILRSLSMPVPAQWWTRGVSKVEQAVYAKAVTLVLRQTKEVSIAITNDHSLMTATAASDTLRRAAR